MPGEREHVFAEIFAEPARARSDPKHFDRDLKSLTAWPHKLVRASTGQSRVYALDGLVQTSLDDPSLAQSLSAALDAQEQAMVQAEHTPASVDEPLIESPRELGYVE